MFGTELMKSVDTAGYFRSHNRHHTTMYIDLIELMDQQRIATKIDGTTSQRRNLASIDTKTRNRSHDSSIEKSSGKHYERLILMLY